jgi:hypothetical protein
MLDSTQDHRTGKHSMVNFELRTNCQYNLSSYVRKSQNIFQKGVDISRKRFER